MDLLRKCSLLGTDAAIQQIQDRNYMQALEGYAGEILLVGINYDKENENKPYSYVIERLEKCVSMG